MNDAKSIIEGGRSEFSVATEEERWPFPPIAREFPLIATANGSKIELLKPFILLLKNLHGKAESP